jgi:hypothetical protein
MCRVRQRSRELFYVYLILSMNWPVSNCCSNVIDIYIYSVGGGALPCVFSFVLNNTPEDSIYTVLADTDAIIVKPHWDTFLRATLKEEYCMAGINPRASLGAVEWNWISFKSAVYRNTTKKYEANSIVTEAYAIPGFKDWGEWWGDAGEMGRMVSNKLCNAAWCTPR